MHTPPDKSKTWDSHGEDGWYLGMAPEHYRCHRVYITKTRSERIANSVKFLPHKCKLTKTTAKDSALEAAIRLIEALQNPAPGAPFSEDPNGTGAALKT